MSPQGIVCQQKPETERNLRKLSVDKLNFEFNFEFELEFRISGPILRKLSLLLLLQICNYNIRIQNIKLKPFLWSFFFPESVFMILFQLNQIDF